MCFPVDFATFLRTTSWWNIMEQLLRNSRTLDNYWKAWESSRKCRNRRPEVFYEKIAHKNFAKFTVKGLSRSHLFNKIAGLSPANLLKKRLLHRCFPVNFRLKKSSFASGNRPRENFFISPTHIVECVSEYILLISKNRQTSKIKTKIQKKATETKENILGKLI